MQDARDTFYVALRGRLATINPERTIVVRGQVRPGILVEENELPTAFQPVDAFSLRWTAMRVDTATPLPLVTMECEISYATDGTAANGGLDRGRLLAAMDGETLHSPQRVTALSAQDELLGRRWHWSCSSRDGHQHLLEPARIRSRNHRRRTHRTRRNGSGLLLPGSG